MLDFLQGRWFNIVRGFIYRYIINDTVEYWFKYWIIDKTINVLLWSTQFLDINFTENM